jgi:predicted metal-dependent enzyme (double-stranded beta helix superfamily)
MSLSETLNALKQKNASFDEAVEKLFEFNYNDYNTIFKISEIEIPHQTYIRLPVFNNENCVAILMLWGVENKTAIHDHKNYNGQIKVLKGNLTEVYYQETSDFIAFEGEGIAPEGAIFAEELGGIHSIVNNDNTYSVSLHIYQTSQLSLDGVKIFDIENKKWALLNEKATSCSWNLPEEAFSKIVMV